MKTKNRKHQMKIEIKQAPSNLTKYTHSVSESAAKNLATRIADLEAAGYVVKSGVSTRSSVPNSYRSAYKMTAPFWVFNSETRQITMVSGKLENRPNGATIPAHIIINGNDTPTGYRALSKSNNLVDLIPA
jgi:type II secretory pathway component PulK